MDCAGSEKLQATNALASFIVNSGGQRSVTVCDNSNVIQARRVIIFLLGIWVGGSIMADFAAYRNFDNVDEFLQSPGSVNASVQLNTLGRDHARTLVRRYVGEDNADLLFNWERISAAAGMTLFFLMLFGDTPNRVNMGSVILMLGIVIGQHFMTPQIADLGRQMDDLPRENSLRSTFGILHGTYSSLEIVKVLLGLLVVYRLSRKDRRQLAVQGGKLG